MVFLFGPPENGPFYLFGLSPCEKGKNEFDDPKNPPEYQFSDDA
jgi:hypothetical protein